MKDTAFDARSVLEVAGRWLGGMEMHEVSRFQPEGRMGDIYNPWGVLEEVILGRKCEEGVIGLTPEVRQAAGFLDILAYDGPLPPELKLDYHKDNYTLLSCLFVCLEISLSDIVEGVIRGVQEYARCVA